MAGGLITAILDKRELSRNFADFVRTTRARDLGRLLKVSARRVTYRAMELTPPFKGAGSIGDWGQQLRQGEIALARDLRKLFFTMEKEALGASRKAIKKSTRATGSGGYVALFASKAGRLFVTRAELFKPQATISQMQAFHRLWLNAKGRVATGRSVQIGNMTVIVKMVVGRASFAAYLRKVRGELGKAKAGFGQSWLRYKGSIKRDGVNVTPPPSWVRRHFGKASSAPVEKLTGDRQFIEIRNSVRYIRDKDKTRIQRGASQYEAATLARQTKAFLERKMANRSKKIDQPIIDI